MKEKVVFCWSGGKDSALALHASELSLPHPVSGETLRFESPLPADIAGLLSTFRPP